MPVLNRAAELQTEVSAQNMMVVDLEASNFSKDEQLIEIFKRLESEGATKKIYYQGVGKD